MATSVNIIDDLWKEITTTATITALVGRRVYATSVEEGKTGLPYIILERVSDVRTRAFNTEAPAYNPRYRIHCHGKDYASAFAVEAVVEAALKDFTGTLGDSTAVQRIEYDQVADFYNPETKTYEISMDFLIMHG